MRVKNFLLNLGWLEICVQLRLGKPEARPMRRYRPASRHRLGHVHNRMLDQLADIFSPDRTS